MIKHQILDINLHYSIFYLINIVLSFSKFLKYLLFYRTLKYNMKLFSYLKFSTIISTN